MNPAAIIVVGANNKGTNGTSSSNGGGGGLGGIISRAATPLFSTPIRRAGSFRGTPQGGNSTA